NITYTQDTKELCSIEYFDRELWRLGAFDVDKGQRAAEEYVRTVLNDKYGKNIDLDEYELTAPNESSVNKNEFIWTKYEDGVALHTVTVVLNRQYEVDSFTAYPIPDKKQYSLYDVEASDYNEVTKHIVDTANGNARNGELYSFYEETPPSPELVYLHPYGQYFVRYTKFIKATKGEEGHGCYVSVYIALDGVPTYTEPQKYDFIKSYDIPEGAYSFELIDSASRIVDSSAPNEIRVADIFGSDDFYPYKSYFYQYSYDSSEYGPNTVLDIYTANGEQYGNAIEVDRNLGKVISFNNRNRPILDKEHLIEISVEEAEAIVSEFVREYYSEIDFGEYTLLYGGTGEDYLSEFSYAIVRNGFVQSRLKVELVSKHIRAFELKPYDKSIEIPAYDDQTLLYFALAEEGITDPIVEYSISRGELVFGANFTYYLTYKAYVTTVDGNGRQQERQEISVELPIKRCAPETELDILISHENRYLSFTEEQIYTDHGIPADTEGIKVTAFDSYSGPLTGENVEMLLGDRTVSFSPVSKHTEYYNYVPVGEINRYKYLDEIYSNVTLKTDSETGDLVSLVLEAEGEYEHRHSETLLDE
ncbi:MAG: hypothetical protein IKZ05_01665, partial [Clostridia bacterium]|nr:hypothetical protein [Clostridia bacterium]